ncbi:MAG: DUF192 domain-containing protein, partial [Actinobacteria bacterium]
MKGLLGRTSLPDGEGLLLKPCGSVHTFFMRFPIDVVFLDRELSVVAVSAEVAPWRTARGEARRCRSSSRPVRLLGSGSSRAC